MRRIVDAGRSTPNIVARGLIERIDAAEARIAQLEGKLARRST